VHSLYAGWKVRIKPPKKTLRKSWVGGDGCARDNFRAMLEELRRKSVHLQSQQSLGPETE